MKNILPFLMLFVFSSAWAQVYKRPTFVKPEKTYKYRVYFTDKKHNTYSLKRPEAFLSEKSLERRKKYKIKVDQHDLPVTPLYVEYLNDHHFKVQNVSKWNNTAVVEVRDTSSIKELSEVNFIKDVRKVWESQDSLLVYPPVDRLQIVSNQRDTMTNVYGKAYRQVSMLNVNKLHQEGYKGDNMTIAIIDGGFYNADCIEGLKNCKVLGTRNFVTPERSVYEETQQHGTQVLSCIAANLPKCLVGTAPNASFYLLISEDNYSENMIEEDNWCAAVEYADSLGVDVITSSLGYYKFDDPSATHKYHELDGETALNSRSASLAASRGILVINSAGNEGDNAWKKIGFPADAKNILSVGAVKANGINTEFSSIGNTADGRIKPDVMAQGEYSAVLDCCGNVSTASGTSFSAPILCGAVTCLLQAFPKSTPEEIIQAVHQSGDNVKYPNNIFGYGIPDMWKAYEILNR